MDLEFIDPTSIWNLPVDGNGCEMRTGAKDYASKYASFVPRRDWTIADQ